MPAPGGRVGSDNTDPGGEWKLSCVVARERGQPGCGWLGRPGTVSSLLSPSAWGSLGPEQGHAVESPSLSQCLCLCRGRTSAPPLDHCQRLGRGASSPKWTPACSGRHPLWRPWGACWWGVDGARALGMGCPHFTLPEREGEGHHLVLCSLPCPLRGRLCTSLSPPNPLLWGFRTTQLPTGHRGPQGRFGGHMYPCGLISGKPLAVSLRPPLDSGALRVPSPPPPRPQHRSPLGCLWRRA